MKKLTIKDIILFADPIVTYLILITIFLQFTIPAVILTILNTYIVIKTNSLYNKYYKLFLLRRSNEIDDSA